MLAASVFIFGGQSQGQGQQNVPIPLGIPGSPIVVTTEWEIPPHISLNTETNISYRIEQSTLANLYLFLCQTNSSETTDLTTDNTWSVAQIPGESNNREPKQ